VSPSKASGVKTTYDVEIAQALCDNLNGFLEVRFFDNERRGETYAGKGSV
jgi:hypothetical protein